MTSAKRKNLRRAVYERDRGVCESCGTDCDGIRTRLLRLKNTNALKWREARRVLTDYGFHLNRNLWEADHKVPLSEGGTDTLDNLVTLCGPCHRAKTAEDAGRRAKKRRLIGRKHHDMRRLWRELGLETA